MNRLMTFAVLKNYQVWDVCIGNNYYNGKYADFSYRGYPVIAGSAEEARQTVLKYADSVLSDLKSKKYSSKRRMLPPRSALPVTEKYIGRVNQRILRNVTRGHKTILSPEGWVEVQLKNSQITDLRKIDET